MDGAGTGDDAFEVRFLNWIRFCRLGIRARPLRCLSIEHRYRPDQATAEDRTGWGDWADAQVQVARARLARLDVLDAQLLDAAFVRLASHHDRRCIKYYYFRTHLKHNWIARKLRVHPLSVESNVRQAKRRMIAAVHALEAQRRLARKRLPSDRDNETNDNFKRRTA